MRILCVLLFPLYLFSQQGILQQAPIVPNPTVYKTLNQEFNLGTNLVIHSKNLPLPLQEYLKNTLFQIHKINCSFSEAEGVIHFNTLRNVPIDEYSINVGQEIYISYSSEASCFYALTTLLQIIRNNNGATTVQQCFISDSPKFSWRGMHLDVSRHFFTTQEVKRFIDLMAFYKFNKFHWHLTDDQGWRIEIKQFPKLTEIGAWRDSTVIGHANTKPNFYAKKREGGFYTQDQIKEIVAYAQSKYITVIPEIEMPGHARAALAAYPMYSCTGKQQGVEGQWGIFDDIYCSKKETIEFNQKILEEVIPLFPSDYIHIGGDEAPKVRWKACPNCQAVLKTNNLKNEHELQSYFIRQIDTYLTSKGKKLIGWDEILDGGISPSAAIMSWRGIEGGIEAVKQKHPVVMTPTSHCYFDYYQATSSTEPLAIGGYLTVEKVYSFDPIPAGLTPLEASSILGGQANVWTEYIPTQQQLEYMVFPRALAMSQALWSYKKPSYTLFATELVNHQLNLLNALQVNYCKAMLYPEINLFRTEKGVGMNVKSLTKGEQFKVDIVSNPSTTTHEAKVLTSKDTLFFDRTLAYKTTKLFTLSIQAQTIKKPLRIEINANATIGIPVELVTPPSEKFNNRGDLALVDGVRGARPWKGDEWLGFDQDTIEIIVDLQQIKKIKEVKIGFLMANGSWIYLPKTVCLSLSKDKKKWNQLHKNKATEYFSQLIFKKSRYVLVKVIADHKIPEGLPGEGFHPWTFIDEIEIITK